MGAFDTSLTPVAVTPANTSDTTLDPDNSASAYVYLDIAHIGATALTVRWGITPSGGSVHWKGYNVAMQPGDAFGSFGPYFLEAGDVLTVRTSDADDVTFSVTGAESSA